VPGYYKDIGGELAAMGRMPADVRALVLTHGHSDHIGFAERLRRERAVPVSVHEADAALARGEVPNPAKGYGPVKLGPLLGFLWFTALHGGLRTPKLQQVATYAVTTGARGPQVAPFTADATQAVKSLARLEAISADQVLPGHGDPWTGGVQEAVRQIRQTPAGAPNPRPAGAEAVICRR